MCARGNQRSKGNSIPQCAEAFPTVERWEPEFFGHRLQTSTIRATVEDSTAGLGQSLRTGRPLVGELFFHGVSGLCTSSLAPGLPGGILAQACEGGRCWPGSLALVAGQLLVIHTPWWRSVLDSVADLGHSTTTRRVETHHDGSAHWTDRSLVLLNKTIV